MEKKYVVQLVMLSLLSCSGLFIIEQVLELSYFIKTAAKIILFLLIPLLYIKFVMKRSILQFLNLKTMDWKNLQQGILLGFLSMVIVIGAFIIFKDFINTDTILVDIQSRMKITPEIFIFIAIYITFGNSLLEEFYFRGFLFLHIHETENKVFAYLYSALLFSIYHVAIFAVWFDFWIMLLALFGLFIIGLVFNWINTKSNNFLNSWILHILADVGVMLIGFYLFGFFS
ncbi:CPBP family intramembrane glutamic endopeptidase [Bacillus kwashiorkori]|uniref:CPBP family intramembrane glutamic endopeptidase n=1 Tax=Bacillus kwashiorkori TaxID=1522318 RepID=UPI0007838358|nr:CPBP family intramembrane glutamic endopeptidase [Bacillus kwashiorkori]